MAVVKWLLHRDEQGRLKVEQNRITYDSKTSPEQSKVIADVWANEGVKITCISVWNHLRGMGWGVYSNDLSFSGRKDTFPA